MISNLPRSSASYEPSAAKSCGSAGTWTVTPLDLTTIVTPVRKMLKWANFFAGEPPRARIGESVRRKVRLPSSPPAQRRARAMCPLAGRARVPIAEIALALPKKERLVIGLNVSVSHRAGQR